MEAVPRLHMLWFSLKSSPEGTNFSTLKKYIAEVYQEDPESYSKEVQALEILRNQAMHPTKDGSALMKRYYCQLHALQSRFPQISERRLLIFHWKDLYANKVHKVHDIQYEMAAVLFNIAATHTQVGASVTRGDADGMKLACTHFQCAAWNFGELRDKYAVINEGSDFMTPELLNFMQQVSYAQAQECILEKSLIDNRKPNIVAKVTSQIVSYYGAALAALLSGGEDGAVAQIIDSSVYKLWKKYVRFKISYLYCILYLYQGQHAEEQQKMGERVTLYQAAWDKLEEARKESRGLPDQKEINESIVFTADVVEAKRKNAKNENEFIYHEAVPELSDIPAVHGANLVNGISFSVTDPEVMGEDIFGRLVPMKAHEASSIYSEKKAQLIRKYSALIEERDNELATFMSSLTLDPLNVNEEKTKKIPQGIVDRCASLNSNKTAITELINAMQQLVEMTTDVELNLKDISEILEAEQNEELEFQKITAVSRTSNAHIIELMREYQKYMEAHTRAGESNQTLRNAMELHVNNLKILAHPLSEIQKFVPHLSGECNNADIFKEVKVLVNKVNEMKAQRQQFYSELRIDISQDDITSKVIAQGIDENNEEALNELLNRELNKHSRLTQLLDQNLTAQKNILVALTDSYAMAAPLIKSVSDIKQKRDTFFSSLAASYDVYEDLLAKSAKGLEFYKKLSANVQKLLTRLKSARDVQKEERQQRLKNINASVTNTHVYSPAVTTSTTSKPKLRDYHKQNTSAVAITAKSIVSDGNTAYIPPIRPNPIGSEAPILTVCQASAFYTTGVTPATVSTAPNEPPPPYSYMTDAVYYPNMMNSMLQQQHLQQQTYNSQQQQQQQQQTHILPPIYTPQPSPNSQLIRMHQGIGQQQIPYVPKGAENMKMATIANPTTENVLLNNCNTDELKLYIHQSEIPDSISSTFPTTISSLQPLYVVTTSNDATYTLQQQQAGLSQIKYITEQKQSISNLKQQEPLASNAQKQHQSIRNLQQQQSTGHTSATNHPGYILNPLTGNYEYGSGYHQATNMNKQFFGQYTSSTQPVAPTDSESATKINVATGFNSPILSHASQAVSTSIGNFKSSIGPTNQSIYNYYEPHYGVAPQQYQQQPIFNITTAPYYVSNINSTPKQQSSETHLQHQSQQYSIYMQSGAQFITTTQTTKSASEYASSVEQQKSLDMPLKKNTVTTTETTSITQKTVSNIDLLTDINFACPEVNNVPPPILPVQVISTAPIQSNDKAQETNTMNTDIGNKETGYKSTANPSLVDSSSCDNFDKLSISSDLNSIETNFDWDVKKMTTSTSISTPSSSVFQHHTPSSNTSTTFIMRPFDPFLDSKVLKYFHKEVERYEKIIESLNMKMLNGNTHLSAKWKDLQDLQNNHKNKLSTVVAKLFPEKNRSLVSLPYDHARVKLERNTDDYINAALIKNVGMGCPNIIIAQTPLQNTITDFWSMIWSKEARTILCLHTPNEMLDPYWPKDLNMELHFDDFLVRCIKINILSHTTEYQLKLSMYGTDPIMDLSVLQIKTWSIRLPSQILGIAGNALQLHQQYCCNYQTPQSPMIFNCLNGSERSEYMVISVATILATESKRPTLINVVDVWSRICTARQNPLRDQTTLEHFLHIVLSHAHEVLNKRGIMTSYQMKIAPQEASDEKGEIKDPLNELDPLWKLK